MIMVLAACSEKKCDCPYNIELFYEEGSDYIKKPLTQFVDSFRFLFYIYNAEAKLSYFDSAFGVYNKHPFETCCLAEGIRTIVDREDNRLIDVYYYSFWDNLERLLISDQCFNFVIQHEYRSNNEIWINFFEYPGGIASPLTDGKEELNRRDSIFRALLLKNKYNLNPWLKEELDRRKIPYRKSFFRCS